MTVQKRSTNKPVNGSLSTAVKKRPVIYISERDPRNNKEYIKSHPGQIIVLSQADFAKWLRQEFSGSEDASGLISGAALNDDETTSMYASTIDNAIKVPGKPVWDPADITYVSSDSGILENIVITFPASASDPGDGSYTYHVNYEIATLTSGATLTGPATASGATTSGAGSSGTATSSTQASATTNANVGAITTVTHTSSLIAIQWPKLASAVGYTIVVTGNNIPGQTISSGTHSYSVVSAGGVSSSSSYGVGSIVSGSYKFALSSQSGRPFSGTYTILVQANYAKGSATGVTYNVKI